MLMHEKLPVSTFILPERFEPEIGNLPELNAIERLGRDNWKTWQNEKLNLTDLDLIEPNIRNTVYQTFAMLSRKSSRISSTQGNRCLSVLLENREQHLQAVGPSVNTVKKLFTLFILTMNEREVVAMEPALHTMVPSRNSFGSFFASEKDVEYEQTLYSQPRSSALA